MPALPARATLVRALRQSHAPALVLSAAVLCACSDKEPPSLQSAPPTYGMTPQRRTNTATALPGQSPEIRPAEQNHALSPDSYPRSNEPPPKAAAEAAPAEQQKERDYSAELAQLLSKSAPGCLAANPASSSSVSLQVSAYVMATGTVSRAEAQGSGLSPAALACIKQAAGALHFQAPVADAPRNVQTQLTLQTEGARAAPQPKEVEEDTRADERDGNPRDSKIHHVDDDPREVEQKLYEATREAPEPPDPTDEPPADNHTD